MNSSAEEGAVSACSLAELYVSFLRTGAAMFGGGYAMLPIVERELSARRGWFSPEQCAEVFALAQLIPGVIAVNTALICGYRLRKTIGAAVAVIAVTTIPICTILLVARFFELVSGNVWADRFLAGLQPAVAGLLVGSAVNCVRREIHNLFSAFMCVATALILIFLDVSPLWILIAAVLLGIVPLPSGWLRSGKGGSL